MDHPDPLDLLKIGMGELDPPLIEFPGYFVEGSLGRGGMGMVFLAQSETSSEDVAIKVLAPELTTDPIATARFEREIATLEKLEHPNLVSIVGRGTTATNSPFLVMEYLAGGDLAGLMEKGPIPLADLSRIIRAVADALEYLHAQDLLHRDLKPSNILFGESHDEIKLADFGLAKFTSDSTNSLSLTRTGAAVGTSHYLAPEILANPKALSPAADWFGLGVIFYQGLTGRLPVGNFEPPSVFGDFSPSIDRFVQRALHSDPAQRFSAAAEWNEEFEKALNPPSKIGRRVAIASGSLICLGAVASWLGWKNWPRKPLESSRFERFESYPWLAKSVWNDINPVEFPDRDFVAQASAHLMAHSFQNNETLAFPGRSLSLQTGSSLHIGGQKARVQIDRLLLDGGTLTSDPFHSLPEGRFDILRGWIANYPERYNPSKQQSSPILQGRIEVRRPSVLATGPAGVWPLRIEAEITGPAPILVAQSFIDEPIRLGRSNPDFSGGWCILGSVIAEAGDALGSGPVIVRRRTLSIMGDSKLGPTVIEGSGVIRIIGATQFESLTIDGEAIPPGSYEAGFNDYRNHFISENAFEVLGVGGPTLDLLNPKPDSAAAGPPIRAKESGRWDLDATWDGPVPIENPNAAYVASEGIAVRGTPFNRGIELFGGHSLTLETGSSLELSGSEGIWIFPKLNLAGGEVTVYSSTRLHSRDLIAGRIEVTRPSAFVLPHFKDSSRRARLIYLDGTLAGDSDLTVRGSTSEGVFSNADASEFSGRWVVASGTLGVLRFDAFANQTVVLTGPKACLRNVLVFAAEVKRVELIDGQLQAYNGSLRIGELVIDGEAVPPGNYGWNAPELKGRCQETLRRVIVGPS